MSRPQRSPASPDPRPSGIAWPRKRESSFPAGIDRGTPQLGQVRSRDYRFSTQTDIYNVAPGEPWTSCHNARHDPASCGGIRPMRPGRRRVICPMPATALRRIDTTSGVGCVDLDDGERAALASLASQVATEASGAPGSLASLTAVAAQLLPSRLVELGDEATVWPPVSSGWLLRGLPIDEGRLGPTPGSWRLGHGAPTPEDCQLLLIGRALGTVFAWADQQGGAPVHNIVPVAGEEDSLLDLVEHHAAGAAHGGRLLRQPCRFPPPALPPKPVPGGHLHIRRAQRRACRRRMPGWRRAAATSSGRTGHTARAVHALPRGAFRWCPSPCRKRPARAR